MTKEGILGDVPKDKFFCFTDVTKGTRRWANCGNNGWVSGVGVTKKGNSSFRGVKVGFVRGTRSRSLSQKGPSWRRIFNTFQPRFGIPPKSPLGVKKEPRWPLQKNSATFYTEHLIFNNFQIISIKMNMLCPRTSDSKRGRQQVKKNRGKKADVRHTGQA